MGASFRNIDEIIELAGCDLLTISPKLLDQLGKTDGTLIKKLNSSDPNTSANKLILNELEFKTMLQKDQMADEKLKEGIVNFSKAIEKLEIQLRDRLCLIENKTVVPLSV